MKAALLPFLGSAYACDSDGGHGVARLPSGGAPQAGSAGQTESSGASGSCTQLDALSAVESSAPCTACVCSAGQVTCAPISGCSDKPAAAGGASGESGAGQGGIPFGTAGSSFAGGGAPNAAGSSFTGSSSLPGAAGMNFSVAGGPGALDRGVLGTWYFVVPADLPRWYQMAVCDDGQALQWTSLSGTGEPDQTEPVLGVASNWSSAKLRLAFPDDKSGITITRAALGYLARDDSVELIDQQTGAISRGVRLTEESSVTPMLTCEG